MPFLHSIDMGLALTAVLMNAAFILLVLTRTSLTTIFVTFILNCFATMIWNFGDFMVLARAGQFWFYFSLIGTSFIPAVMFHFVNALVGSTSTRVWIAIAYVLCLPLALSSCFVSVAPAIRSFVDGPRWNVCYFMVLLPFFAAGIAMLVKRIREVQPDEASRLRYILIAAFIACLLGITELLPTLKVPAPRLGHFGSVLYSSILAIGLFKHRTAYDILAEMRVKLDMLNELSSGIAHELRNPLSSILGAASLLRNKSEELRDEKSREYLDLISEEVGRLEGILKNYSALIRPMRIEREPIPINQVIQKTVALMQLNAEVPRMQLELAREIPLCRCDPQTMQQVFINLIKNAYEACGASGLIHIETEFIRQFVRITFRDSGKGIPPAILPRVFEPFVSTKTNGMGLGLAICRRLVDLNGGTIEATNENIGACFIIHLPAAETVLPAA